MHYHLNNAHISYQKNITRIDNKRRYIGFKLKLIVDKNHKYESTEVKKLAEAEVQF